MNKIRFIGIMTTFVVMVLCLGMTNGSAYADFCPGSVPCITSNDIINGQIAGGDVNPAIQMPGTNITNNSVQSIDIQDSTITSTDIAADTITAADIAADAVGSSEIAAGAVGSSEIAAGAVGSTQINNAQVQSRVTGTCAAGNSIRTVNTDGTVICEPDDIGSGANFIQNQSAAPQAGSFYIDGIARTSGLIRTGNETGTTQTHIYNGIVIRPIRSTLSTAGNIMARTNNLTLERDGSDAGWQITNTGSGNEVINCIGLTNIGASNNKSLTLAVGTTALYADGNNIVYMSCMFGDPFSSSYNTQITIQRYTGDHYWTGFVTSNYNQ